MFILKHIKARQLLWLNHFQHPLYLLLQQFHLVVIGHFHECGEQIFEIATADDRFEIASTRTQFRDVFTLDLFASGAPQILQSVGYLFTLHHLQQSYFDFHIIVEHKALRAQPHGSMEMKVNL